MTEISNLVQQIKKRERTLDIATLNKLTKAVTDDAAVDPKGELALLQDLFASSSIDATPVARKMMGAFIDQAQKLVDNGQASDGDAVENLNGVAVQYATSIFSEDAIAPLLDKYQATRGRKGAFTHEYSSNVDIEAVRLGWSHMLAKYTSSGFSRFFTKLFRPAHARKLESDPLQDLRNHLQENYTRA